jgi:hypothetical protein
MSGPLIVNDAAQYLATLRQEEWVLQFGMMIEYSALVLGRPNGKPFKLLQRQRLKTDTSKGGRKCVSSSVGQIARQHRHFR